MKESDGVCQESVYQGLYSQLAEGLWRFAYLRCGDTDNANDLCQDAFIKLWKNCSKVSPEKAKPYLYRIVHNTFLNQVAHKKIVLKYANSQSGGLDEQSPQYLLEEKEFADRLQTAINNLSEAQRTAFLMNRVEGLKYSEIASALDISVKAVEKRMSQALRRLRDELKTNKLG